MSFSVILKDFSEIQLLIEGGEKVFKRWRENFSPLHLVPFEYDVWLQTEEKWNIVHRYFPENEIMLLFSEIQLIIPHIFPSAKHSLQNNFGGLNILLDPDILSGSHEGNSCPLLWKKRLSVST